MSQQLGGGWKPVASRAGQWGLWLECAEWQRPREPLCLVGLSLGLPDTNQLGLGSGGRAASSQVSRILCGIFLPVCPALVLPQLIPQTQGRKAPLPL